MCHLYLEGPVSISGAKSSSDCSTPPLVVPVATFAPTPATPATEQRIQGSGQLMHHEMTAFQPSSHGYLFYSLVQSCGLLTITIISCK